MKNQNNSRRDFLKKSTVFSAGAMIIPTIVPSTVFGKTAPSNQINVGMIATGRQAINVNLKNGFLKLDNCRVIAINDVDSWRMSFAEKIINDTYSKAGKNYSGVKNTMITAKLLPTKMWMPLWFRLPTTGMHRKPLQRRWLANTFRWKKRLHLHPHGKSSG
jgi:hypothetical protein